MCVSKTKTTNEWINDPYNIHKYKRKKKRKSTSGKCQLAENGTQRQVKTTELLVIDHHHHHHLMCGFGFLNESTKTYRNDISDNFFVVVVHIMNEMMKTSYKNFHLLS